MTDHTHNPFIDKLRHKLAERGYAGEALEAKLLELLARPLPPAVTEVMERFKLRQQRRRYIHMEDQIYTWIPFEHCVCVWNKIMRPEHRSPVNAELPAQFARRRDDEPVLLSDVAHFIKRIFLSDQPPMAEGRIILLTQEPSPMRKRSWHPIDIIGSFNEADAELAQQVAKTRTAKSNLCVYRALTIDLYAKP